MHFVLLKRKGEPARAAPKGQAGSWDTAGCPRQRTGITAAPMGVQVVTRRDEKQGCCSSIGTAAGHIQGTRGLPHQAHDGRQSTLLTGIQIQARNKESFVPLISKVFAISFSGFRISTTANRPSGKAKQNKLHNTQSHCSELWKDTNCILLKSFFFFLRIFNCLSLKEKNKYNPTCYDKSDTKIFFFKWNKGTKTWEAATQHVWCIF